jgi:hypothetical protein
MVLYENAAWAPERSVLPAGAVDASRSSGPDAARTTELGGATPALPVQVSPTKFRGRWPGPELYYSAAYSSRWHFRAAGQQVEHRKAFGWANAFAAGPADNATLSYTTSPIRYAALLLQLGLWFAALRAVIPALRRRRESGGVDDRTVDEDEVVEFVPAGRVVPDADEEGAPA